MKQVRQADGTYREVAEDGDTIRVPLSLCDSTRQPLAELIQRELRAESPVLDAAGRPAGNKPGYLFPAPGTDTARQIAVNDALRLTRRAMLEDSPSAGVTRDAYIASLQNAWRGKP